MQETDELVDDIEVALDVRTLAPVQRAREPWFEDDDSEVLRPMDPWASVKGLLVLFLGVAGVVALGWGTGVLALPGSQAGAQECARTCVSMGTQMSSFANGTCVCRQP